MPITLRLTLAPERETATFQDNATVQELYRTACQKFGLTACTFMTGFPRVLLDLKGKEGMTLSEAGIESQQSLFVVPSVEVKADTGTVVEAVAPSSKNNQSIGSSTNPYSKKKPKQSIIPGLTKSHYVKSSQQTATEIPTRLSGSEIETTTGKFDIRWNAPGSNGATYLVSATGNVLFSSKSPLLQVHCSCPAFSKKSGQVNRLPVPVCKHLAAALDSMIDKQGGQQGNEVRAVAAAKPKNAVVDLLSDSSSDSDEDVKKRSAVSTTTRPEKKIKKRRVVESATTTNSLRAEAPIKILATPQDMELRKQHDSHGCWDQCKTLREILFGNDAVSSIQWMVVSNFLIDFEDLAVQLPELLGTIPRVTIFHSDQAPSPTNWPDSVDFQQLNPAADPQTAKNPLRYRFDYGSHHTKLFLVGYANKIRVVVSTSNLLAMDRNKAQAAYVEEFPVKSHSDQGTTSDFEETLIYYMSSYGYNKKFRWMGSTTTTTSNNNRETLIQTLARYDYSQAKGVLIPSIPGYHNIDDKTPRVGQLKLREAIQQYTRPYNNNNNNNNNSAAHRRPVVCQFSSIGSTSEKYLHTLQTSMDMCLARTGETGRGPLRLQLVYPTVQEIRDSVEGYVGGGTVPGYKKNVSKPFLQPLWRKWRGRSTGTTIGSNPLAKPNNVPHIKTYYQTNDTNDGFGWLCLTSHNISAAAWGTIGKNKFGGGERLYVRSWELGVFVSPRTLGVDKLVSWTGVGPSNTCTTKADRGPTSRIATIPVPYQTHGLQEYNENDEPWAVDQTYAMPDRFGRRSCAM